MTAMIDWRSNPRYAKVIQRLARMRPDQRAIFSTAMADKEFANEAMQKHLQGLSLAADRQAKDRHFSLASRSLGLSKKAFDTRTNLTRAGMDFEKKQGRLGTMMAAANIPISGYTGYKSMQRDFDEAEETKQFRKKLLESYGGVK